MSEVAKAMIESSGMRPTVADASPATDEWFVINLCASMTPMPSVPKSLAGFEEFKLFQVSRVEDGRRRYRLRLGFFNCQAEAELLLGSIRTLYPAAFAGAASQEDLRFRGETQIATKSTAQKPVAAEPAIVKAAVVKQAPAEKTALESVAAAKPAAPATIVTKIETAPLRQPAAVKVEQPKAELKAAKAPEKPAKPNEDDATRIMPAAIRVSAAGKATALQVDAKSLDTSEMSLEFNPTPEPGVPEAAVHAKAEIKAIDSKPFHVGRGVDVPDVQLEFVPEAARKISPEAKAAAPVNANAKPAPQPAAAGIAKPAAGTSTKTSAPATSRPAAAAASAPAAAGNMLPGASRVMDDYVPVLDTTLTIRTLTQAEKDDPNQPTWFAVELTSSEHPFNLEAMPRLDIFAAYRLYSVVVSDGGKVHHALRLGFFKEEVSADAVSGYLKTFFPTPIIKRIGVAEYNRFAEPKPKPVATQNDNVVKLAEKRDHAVPSAATATANSTPANTPRGNGAKLSQAAMNKGASKALAAESGIRQVPRPQSFFARLIGRDLD